MDFSENFLCLMFPLYLLAIALQSYALFGSCFLYITIHIKIQSRKVRVLLAPIEKLLIEWTHRATLCPNLARYG